MPQEISNLSTTWNSAGTTYNGIKLNVTDTSSAAASNLMDLQVAGASKFKVSKSGVGYFSGINDFSPDITFGPTAAVGIGQYVNNSFFIRLGALTPLVVQASSLSVQVGFGYSLGFTPASGATSNPDVTLHRDAADTLALRRATNPQVFRIYNTFTDASNYERGKIAWSGNILQIGTEKLGTGTARALELQTDGTTRLTIGATGVVETSGAFVSLGASGVTSAGYLGGWSAGRIGFANVATFSAGATLDTYISRAAAGVIGITSAAELTEMTAPAAPAANKVRIYAEDDGAGKTRLMALFATGAAVQIAIEP